MAISAKTRLVCTTLDFYFISQHYLYCPRNGSPKFQLIMVSTFWNYSVDSRKKHKEIDVYSDYTKNILQAVTFAAITSVWISLQCWNLAYNVDHGLADQPRYSFSPAVICA